MQAQNQNDPCALHGECTLPITPAAMRRSYCRFGWAIFAVAAFPFLVSLILSLLAALPSCEKVLLPVLEEYPLLLNEALISVAVLIGLWILHGIPRETPARARLPFRTLFCAFAICVGLSSIGNMVGMLWTSPIDAFLGSGDVSNETMDLIFSQAPWQMILCVVILAPVLEEFFFRKLLIDCLHPYGELLAILTSGFLFGLFHQNLTQYFYAFAIGIVLAYLYCRTGSFVTVTLMHAAINLFFGVLPTLVSGKAQEFFLLLENTETSALVDQLPSLFLEYALPVLLYVLHLMLFIVLAIAGIIIFIFSFKKLRFRDPPSSISVYGQWTGAYINAGMLTSVIVLLGATALSVFLY